MKKTIKLLALILALMLTFAVFALAEEAADTTENEEAATEVEETVTEAEEVTAEETAAEEETTVEEPADPEATPAPIKELSGFIGTHFMSFVNKIGDMWPMEGDLTRYEDEVLGVMTDQGELIDLMVFRTGGQYSLYGIKTGMTLDEGRAILLSDGWDEREEDGWLSGAGSVGHRFDRGEGAMVILFAGDDGVIEQVMGGTQLAALQVKVAEVKEFTSATPTPEPTATPDPSASSGGTVKVKSGTEMVNVRSGAGTGYDIVAQMSSGESAEYLGEGVADENGTCWYKIEYNGKTGYVSAKFTTCTLLDGTFISVERGTLDY